MNNSGRAWSFVILAALLLALLATNRAVEYGAASCAPTPAEVYDLHAGYEVARKDSVRP